MAALIRDRMTREERWNQHLFPLAPGKRAFKGGIAVWDDLTLSAAPASANANLFPLGLFAENIDNSTGTTSVEVNVRMFRERIIFWWGNDSGAGAIALDDIGKPCYLLDDQTVTITATGHTELGTVWAVDPVRGIAVEVM